MLYEINKECGISDFYFCERRINNTSMPHIHSHIEFIFVLDGRLEITIDKNSHRVNKNETVVIMPYEVHNYEPDGYAEFFIIACPPEYISEYRQALNGKYFYPPVARFEDDSRAVIENIVKSDYKDDFKKKALLYCALSCLNAGCKLMARKSQEYDLYRKAIAYISEHYTENLKLETVSRKMGVTSSHLSRILNQKSGSSFSDILNALRIYEAKRLLEQTNLSISEVAFNSGYGSIRNFNRIFFKHFQCNPKDIRSR